MACFILFPRSLKKASASCPKTPEVSIAMGMKWLVEDMRLTIIYLSFLVHADKTCQPWFSSFRSVRSVQLFLFTSCTFVLPLLESSYESADIIQR